MARELEMTRSLRTGLIVMGGALAVALVGALADPSLRAALLYLNAYEALIIAPLCAGMLQWYADVCVAAIRDHPEEFAKGGPGPPWTGSIRRHWSARGPTRRGYSSSGT